MCDTYLILYLNDTFSLFNKIQMITFNFHLDFEYGKKN